MNPENTTNLTPPTTTALQASLDARIIRALEQKPQTQVAADFAGRVASRAAAQPLRRRRSAPQFGKMIALLSAVIASIALFALAPHAVPNVKSLSFDTEVILLAELALIGGWIARLSAGSRNSH